MNAGETLATLTAQTIATLALWGAIEVVDALASGFSLHWWLSLLIAVVLIFGGVLIITDADLS